MTEPSSVTEPVLDTDPEVEVAQDNPYDDNRTTDQDTVPDIDEDSP